MRSSLKKIKKHNHYEQNSTWAKKTICTTDFMQKTEKVICIQIADVSSSRRNCNILVSTQGIDFKFSGNLKN